MTLKSLSMNCFRKFKRLQLTFQVVSGTRTLGVWLAQGVGVITGVPRPCMVRQEVEAWGQPQGARPLGLAKPGRTRQEPPRQWHGHRVVRRVPVEDPDGRLAVAARRVRVVHSRQVAHQTAAA